jgi:C-terminal processing protease CtpA/Prc
LERRQGKQLKQGAMGLVWRQETGRRERSEGADASDTDHICRDAPNFWRDEDFLRHLVSGQLSADKDPHADFFRPDALSLFQTDADAPEMVGV